MKQIDLSIIILNYNTKEVTLDAIRSIEKNYPDEVVSGNFEVIVTDNASTDGSLETFKEYKKKSKIASFHVVDNGGNIGFAAGNNKGIAYAKGRYVLFLNPDTIVYPETLETLITFMDTHIDVGAVTCALRMENGMLDEAAHRGFPTPWNAFCHFSKLEKAFPKSRLFSGYIQGWKNMQENHEVDAISGAFLFVRREVGEAIKWWDEEYFFYGEDLQFCYDIKQKGYNIYYVPEVSILHYGGVSSGIKKRTEKMTTADAARKRQVQGWRFDAMRIFYEKNYKDIYPGFVNWLVFQGITFLQKRNTPKES